MKKSFLLLLILALFIPLSLSCGKATSETGTNTGGSTTTLTGSVVADSSDLVKLGATTYSVSLQSTNAALISQRLSNVELKGILKPTAVSNTLIALKKVGSNGELEAATNASGQAITGYTDSSGSYTLNDVPAGVEYVLDVLKTGGGKTLQMQAPIYADANASSVTQNITPKTTVVAKAIISEVTAVLRTNRFSATIIKEVNNTIIDTINSLVDEGTIIVPSVVRDSSDSDNNQVKNTAQIISRQGNAKRAIDTIKMSAKAGKGASDLETAKGYIGDVTLVMTGQRSGIPQVMQDALAQAYYNRETATVAEIYAAITAALPPGGSLNFTAAEFATLLNNMVKTILNNMSSKISESNFAIIASAFPESFKTSTISTNTSLNIPQTMLCVQYLMDQNISFDPALMMQELGIFDMSNMSGMEIVHSEVKLVNYMGWNSSQAVKTLSCHVSLMDLSNTGFSNVTVQLTYPTTSGNQTINISASQYANFGPSSNKSYELNPWSSGGVGIPTGVTAGDFIITAKDGSGNTLATKTITIPNIDLSNTTINWVNPAQSNGFQDMAIIVAGKKPILQWEINDAPDMTSFTGYELRTDLRIEKEGAGTIYPPSYNSQNPSPPPAPLTGTSFAWPSDIPSPEAGLNYRISAVPVIVKKGVEQPIMEGTGYGNTAVECLSESAANARKAQQLATITLSGSITELSSPPAGATLMVAYVRMPNFNWGETTTYSLTPILNTMGTVSNDKTSWELDITYSNLKAIFYDQTDGRPELIAFYDKNGNGKLDMGPNGDSFIHPKNKIDYFGGDLKILDMVNNQVKDLNSTTVDNLDFTFESFQPLSF